VGETLSRRFGARLALAGVDLEAPRGQALLIAGHNGAGKSTLLRILATAIHADGGSARIAGFDLRREREEVRRRVALLGHALYHYEPLTAIENLAIVARHLGLPAGRIALLPYLERVGLADRGDDSVASFSAGMRKRLALARLALKPAEVFLLDEPYGQLDAAGFVAVDEFVRELKRRGATVLFSTHQLERARAFCERGVLLERGRVRLAGAVDDVVAEALAGLAQARG
jgi:heme exporter protein A